MYVINQTFNFDSEHEVVWKKWVRSVYVPTLMSHPDFAKSRIFKIISENNQNGSTYAVQFEVAAIVPIGAALDTFSIYNKSIREQFADQVVFFTTLLKEQDVN